MNHLIKVYKVEFMRYFYGWRRDEVTDEEGHSIKLKDGNLFLITENNIDKIKKYGNGIKELTFVGYLLLDDID